MRGVDFVYHAAALKQVTSCEFYPLEAIKTNVLGTENVLEAAVARGLKSCLFEHRQHLPHQCYGDIQGDDGKSGSRQSRIVPSGTMICATRYGNVMASRGRLFPCFLSKSKQVELSVLPIQI